MDALKHADDARSSQPESALTEDRLEPRVPAEYPVSPRALAEGNPEMASAPSDWRVEPGPPALISDERGEASWEAVPVAAGQDAASAAAVAPDLDQTVPPLSFDTVPPGWGNSLGLVLLVLLTVLAVAGYASFLWRGHWPWQPDPVSPTASAEAPDSPLRQARFESGQADADDVAPQHPPERVEATEAALRADALEADRLASAGPPPATREVSASAPVAEVPFPLETPIQLRRSDAQADPTLLAAWQAMQAGHWAAARDAYRQVLRVDPTQRDALLGLAVVAVQTGRPEDAAALYRRVLVLNPQDELARSGLIGLADAGEEGEQALRRLAGQGDQVAAAQLADRLAAAGRWAEAQPLYFEAFARDPASADLAYNLAVALDHLAQPRLAADYYRRALDLAGVTGAQFDRDALRRRLVQLSES